jgi:hypothetical protein
MSWVKLTRGTFHFFSCSLLAAVMGGSADGKSPQWLQDRFLKIHMELNVPNRANRQVGERFDVQAFKQSIKTSRVQVVTLFAKDAYGNSFFQTRHGYFDPGLKFDLVKKQVDALHELGIKVLTHYSVADDSHIDLYHPDWISEDLNHKPLGGGPISNRTCLNSPYREEMLIPQLEELARLGVDGFWLDILHRPDGCFCQHCRKKFQERYQTELTPDEPRRFQFWWESWEETLAQINGHVRAINPDLAITYNPASMNGGANLLTQAQRGLIDFFTTESHLNASSGYEDHQIRARYYRALGVPFDIQNMTNIERWDDSTLKSVDMLKVEFSQILAHGGRIAAGTQLYPWGEYERVGAGVLGEAFQFVEARLPFAFGARSVPYAAVLLPDGVPGLGLGVVTSDHGLVGIMSALAQIHLQFDILEPGNGGYELLQNYKLAIMPQPEATFRGSTGRSELQRFLKLGGKLLLISNKRDLDVETLSTLGLKVSSRAWKVQSGTLQGNNTAEPFPFEGDLIALEGSGSKTAVSLSTGNEVLPAVSLLTNQISYIGWPLGQVYYDTAYPEWRKYLAEALAALGLTLPYEVQGPANLDVNLMQRRGEYLLHLTYVPVQRGIPGVMPQLWKVAPLQSVRVSVRCPRPSSVFLEPGGKQLQFNYDGSTAHIQVGEVNLYEVVRISTQ